MCLTNMYHYYYYVTIYNSDIHKGASLVIHDPNLYVLIAYISYNMSERLSQHQLSPPSSKSRYNRVWCVYVTLHLVQ
jgi:hypothetical protein